jgi:hydrogenase expression/formation protein HypC
MCVAAPMRLVSIEGDRGRAELGGVLREISLALLPGAAIGDYVLVHAGFAIGTVDEELARATLDDLEEIAGRGGSAGDAPA